MDLGKPKKRRVIERIEPAKQPAQQPAEQPAKDEAAEGLER